MKTEYIRVIPRDLFNEAKLLKCMGVLCLAILDNKTPCKMESEHNGETFEVVLLQEGSLTISNIQIIVKGLELTFKTTYNSKANYPLYVEYNEEDFEVFNEQGEFSKDFINLCKTI